jgi:endonuclease-3
MKAKERVRHVIAYFQKHNPEAATELQYANPYELLVAVILSAQCTDKRVNMVTPALFARFPDVYALAASSAEEIFTFIRSISYPNNKAKHLEGMAKRIVSEFKGEIPSTVEELKTLPGVGQKTANVVVSVVFNTPAMPVDTHVFRVAARIGLSRNAKTPEQTEKQLLKIIPRDTLSVAHHWLILHGRYVCVARTPKCELCGIKKFCLYFETKTKKRGGIRVNAPKRKK